METNHILKVGDLVTFPSTEPDYDDEIGRISELGEICKIEGVCRNFEAKLEDLTFYPYPYYVCGEEF